MQNVRRHLSVKAGNLTGVEQKNGIVVEPPSKKNYKQEVAFIKRDFKQHKKSPIPKGIKPMEATLLDAPFSTALTLPDSAASKRHSRNI